MMNLADIRHLATQRRSVNVPVFLDALRSPDSSIRAAACDALGWLRDPVHAPPLMAVIEDESETVRYAATANLALCGSPSSAVVLVKRLKSDTSPRVRARAARVIGFLALSEGPALLEQLNRESINEVLAQIIYALGQLRYAQAKDVIAARLNDSNTALRIECIRALTRLDPNRKLPSENLTHQDPHVRIEAIRNLCLYDPEAVCRQAQALFKDENAGVRCAVVIGLRQIDTPASRASLANLPNDPHPEVQRHLERRS